MGYSFTEYHGTGFWARDNRLQLWIHLLACEIDRLAGAPQSLREAAELWHAQGMDAPPGCIRVDLDKHLTSPACVEVLVGVSEKILAWLDAQGPTLPMALLNSLGAPELGWGKDMPTEVFKSIGRAFTGLLKGEIWWQPTSTFL